MAIAYADLSASNVPTAEFKKHYEARPVKLPDLFDDIDLARKKRRKHLDLLLHSQPIPSPIPQQVQEGEVLIKADDGFDIPVTVYNPNSMESTPSHGLPIVILFHEGGWHVGDRKDEEMNARMFVRDLHCIVINVEYRLAPEFKFPIGINDCYSVLKTVAGQPSSFHAFAKPELGIVLGGSSAGANLAACLAQRALNDKLEPPVTGQWLSAGSILPPSLVPDKYKADYISHAENHDDPVIHDFPAAKFQGMEQALGIKNNDDLLWSPFASSIYPPRVDHKGRVAKAFFQIGGMDPLRDHSLVYDRALREEWGVETRMNLYPGYGHMFW
jgi:acetyl esterase/lipase